MALVVVAVLAEVLVVVVALAIERLVDVLLLA